LNALVESIVGEKFAPGESLPSEAEMCEVYGVSRSSVREALRVLSEKGLIEVRHGLGTRVNPPERWDFMDSLVLSARRKIGAMGPIFNDLHEARQILESEVAALAAQRAGAEDRERLQSALNEMQAALTDATVFSDAAFAFHRTLFEATGNRVLLRMTAPIREVLTYTIHAAARAPGALDRTHNDLQAVADAIGASDSNAARNAMRDHLDRVRRDIK
jgi:DNA-binding FadR family transcriptional regulator